MTAGFDLTEAVGSNSIRTRKQFSDWPTFVGIQSVCTQLSRFKILTTAHSQFHLSLLEAVYISRKKKRICAGKSSSYSLYNCFGKIKACCHWIDCISPYYCAISKCISPYCIWSLRDPAHHIPNQTEIATEEFCSKRLLRKQNKIDFVESHFQILHHLKVVQKPNSSKFYFHVKKKQLICGFFNCKLRALMLCVQNRKKLVTVFVAIENCVHIINIS